MKLNQNIRSWKSTFCLQCKQNLKALKIKIELCGYVLTMLLFYCLNVVQSRLELFYLSFLLNIWFIVIFADCQFTLLCVLIQYLFATSENEQVFDVWFVVSFEHSECPLTNVTAAERIDRVKLSRKVIILLSPMITNRYLKTWKCIL